MTDPTTELPADTPIGDQVAAETQIEQPDLTPAAETPDIAPADGGTFNAVDGSERPNYGYFDGRFYSLFTVKAAGGPLSEQQLNDCAGEVRLHAVNNGYLATDNSHDTTTQTSEDGQVARVIVSVPVRENTVKAAEAAAVDQTPES